MFQMTFNGVGLFLTILETLKSKIKTWTYLVSPSWLVQGIFLLSSSGRRNKAVGLCLLGFCFCGFVGGSAVVFTCLFGEQEDLQVSLGRGSSFVIKSIS